MTNVTITNAWAQWADSFMRAPIAPMNTEESALYASCLLNSAADGFPGEQVKGSFAFRLISKRAALLGLDMDIGAVTYFAVTTKSPGAAVMYLHALKYALRKRNPGEAGVDKVDLKVVSEVFPYGFVDPRSLEGLWDGQKGHVFGLPYDNMLDQMHSELAVVPAPAPEEVEPADESEAESLEGRGD